MADVRNYNYKQPRKVNWVTILLVAGLVCGGYYGMKVGPVYWKRYKVDQALSEAKAEGADIYRLNPTHQRGRAEEVLAKAYERIEALGLSEEEHGLAIYFETDYSALHADYTMVVEFVVGSPKTYEMHRSVEMPKERGGF